MSSVHAKCEWGPDLKYLFLPGDQCERGWNVLLLHAPLPDVHPDTVRSISFSLNLLLVGNGGIDVVLHGMGPRGFSSIDALGRQTNRDFFVGVDDPCVHLC